MKLNQLRSLVEIAENNLNVTQAAAVLRVHQSIISRQIRALERELGVDLLVRNGKRLDGLTEPGKSIVHVARRMLDDAGSISRITSEYAGTSHRTLTVATTRTHARYSLHPIIKRFARRHPEIRLKLRHGDPVELAEIVRKGEADLFIGSVPAPEASGLTTFAGYSMDLAVLTPPGHPLLQSQRLLLEELAHHPILTYEEHFMTRASVERAFKNAGLTPNIALGANDTDIIKTYVNLGRGVGVVPKVAYKRRRDRRLRVIDASHLFEPYMVHLGFRPRNGLRRYAYSFIEMYAPHVARAIVARGGSGLPGT